MLAGHVVVREHDREEGRQRFVTALPAIAQFLLEHVHAVLVGDGHVVRRVLARGSVEERLGQRERDRHADAGLLVHLLLDRLRHLGAEAEVVERHGVARQVLPEGAGFVVVLGVDHRAGAVDVAPAWRGAEGTRLDARSRVHFDPLVRVDADDPAVSGVGLIRIAVEVVADREPVRERMVVRRDVHPVEHARAVATRHPHPEPEGGPGRIAARVAPLAEDLVVRAVLLDDEDDVLDRAVGTGVVVRQSARRLRGYGPPHVGVLHHLSRAVGQHGAARCVDDLQGALHDVAGMQAAPRVCEVGPGVPAGSESLGTRHVQPLAIR